MHLSHRWLRGLPSVTLAAVALVSSCPAISAQGPDNLSPLYRARMPQQQGDNPQIGGQPAGQPSTAPGGPLQASQAPASGGLQAVNPWAEDAEAVAARYRVPETNDVTELMAFIFYLRRFEAHDTQTYTIHRKQMPIAVKAAAEKIVKIEKANYKPTLEQPEPTSNAYHQASMLILIAQVQTLADLTAAEQHELYLNVKKKLEVTHPPKGDYLLATQLATRLEAANNTALAAEAYSGLAPLFQRSDDEEVTEMGKAFSAAARRLSLVGKPVEVVGHTVDGKPFDWKAYRGKVVLIDYWFVGCKPCRDELPNVKRLYQLYHDRGFEVVGVNVDESRAQVEAFLKTETIPWVNLFDTMSTGDHPMTAYYGVMGFPTVMLVGKDGNVVSLDARGEKLQELLASLLGPAGGDQPVQRNARTGARPPQR